jgi:hypothetical protein
MRAGEEEKGAANSLLEGRQGSSQGKRARGRPRRLLLPKTTAGGLFRGPGELVPVGVCV